MQVHEPNFYGLKNNGQMGNDDLSKLVMEGTVLTPLLSWKKR